MRCAITYLGALRRISASASSRRRSSSDITRPTDERAEKCGDEDRRRELPTFLDSLHHTGRGLAATGRETTS